MYRGAFMDAVSAVEFLLLLLVYSGVKLNRLSLQLADFKPFKIFSTLM
jgi:hypothetical protein